MQLNDRGSGYSLVQDPNESNKNDGTFPPRTKRNNYQQKTGSVTKKRLHTVFVLSSCVVILQAAKVKHTPNLRRCLQFVMLLLCLLSICSSLCLPLWCLSNTSTSSFILFFVLACSESVTFTSHTFTLSPERT